MIIDAHAHLSTTDFGRVELYLEALRQAGVDGGVVLPGGMMDVRRMTDYITGKKQPENPVPNNEYVAHCLDAHDHLVAGFVCVDPHRPDALPYLVEQVQQGFRGLKLSPITHQFSFAGKVMGELVEWCGEQGVPVYSHVLYSPGANTARFVALAKQFPKTHFILGHMGFGPADQDGLEAAVSLDNFFLESSLGNVLHLQETVNRAGAGKLVFGSEFPLSHPAAELQKILLLKVSDDGREKILGENIRELLGLAKGKGAVIHGGQGPVDNHQ